MCDPLTIGGIALSGASMLANQAAQSQVNKARKGAMTAERIRQGALQKEAEALNVRSQDRYTDFEGQQGEKSTNLGDYFAAQNEGASATATEGAPTETLPTSTSNITVQEQTKQKGAAKAYSDDQARALGELRAFGDLLGDVSRLQGRDASQVGTLGGFMKGWSSVLPYELEAANSKGGGMRMLGDILGGAGQLGTMYGLSGGTLGGLGGAAAAAPKGAISVAGAAGPMSKAAGGMAAIPSGFAKTTNPYKVF